MTTLRLFPLQRPTLVDGVSYPQLFIGKLAKDEGGLVVGVDDPVYAELETTYITDAFALADSSTTLAISKPGIYRVWFSLNQTPSTDNSVAHAQVFLVDGEQPLGGRTYSTTVDDLDRDLVGIVRVTQALLDANDGVYRVALKLLEQDANSDTESGVLVELLAVE